MDNSLYSLAADIILIIHFLFVLFVVLSLLLIFIGKFRKWRWVKNFWFRVSHLAAIGIVVLQSWLGIVCPLTTWEMELRQKAEEVVYQESFIAYWLNKILYYQAPWWVFVVIYTLFGSLVICSWFWVKPKRLKRGE